MMTPAATVFGSVAVGCCRSSAKTSLAGGARSDCWAGGGVRPTATTLGSARAMTSTSVRSSAATAACIVGGGRGRLGARVRKRARG